MNEMNILPGDSTVVCRMDKSYNFLRARPASCIGAYYGRVSELGQLFQVLRRVLSDYENDRVNRLRNRDDQIAYILSHGILRLLVSARIGTEPKRIVIERDDNGRPFLPGSKLFFNISHTREAFSIVIADTYFPGVDIEKIDRKIDYSDIAGNYFSAGETEFISGSREGSREAFFQLWTRKEALLKSIGSGIVTRLQSIEVSADLNIIPSCLFPEKKYRPLYEEYWLYSIELSDHFLSIAVPERRDISLVNLQKNIVHRLIGKRIEELA